MCQVVFKITSKVCRKILKEFVFIIDFIFIVMKFTGKRNPKRQKAVNDFLGLEGEQKLNANEHSTFEAAINALKTR